MDNTMQAVERYRERRQKRLDERRNDGGPGSGNWGHVGIPNYHGGSMPGGGLAFRFNKNYKVKDPRKKYTSLSKKQQKWKKDLAKAKKSGDKRYVERIKARAANLNLRVKSFKHLVSKGTFDLESSKHILGDVKRSASRTKSGVVGTAEAIHQAFPRKRKK